MTGSGRGIGKTTALLLAKEGAKVLVNDVESEFAEKVAIEIEQNGSEVAVVSGFTDGDITNENSCIKIVEKSIKELGGLHILVNCAGITRDKVIHKMNDQMWTEVMNVNLKGTFLMCKAVYNIFKKQKYGKIINLSSIAGLGSTLGQINYAATKAAVISLTKSLAKELASFNVCVNAVAPGPINTRLMREVPPETFKRLTESIPMGIGKPIDVARVILGLCSSDFDYVTGQLIVVSGGQII